MKRHTPASGFTLLELLLVVGIAAVLIIGGIVTYSVVSRTHKTSETVRAIQLIIVQTRKLKGFSSSYGAPGTDLEVAVANSGNLPPKFLNGSQIINPYNATSSATVLLAGVDATFSIDMALPPFIVPQIAASLNPNDSAIIDFIRVCGTGIADGDTMLTIPEMATLCGRGEQAAALNFNLVTR